MNTETSNSTTLIIVSLLLALLLSVIGMPETTEHLRPPWMLLTLIFWTLNAPDKVGIATAWIMGLLVDAMSGVLLGSHALGMSLVIFIVMNIYQRLRIFPIWQQASLVFLLLLVERVIQYWVLGISKGISPGLEFWLSPLVGLFIWPWLSIIYTELLHRLADRS
jgi:rod shape-determining protein MreD